VFRVVGIEGFEGFEGFEEFESLKVGGAFRVPCSMFRVIGIEVYYRWKNYSAYPINESTN